MYEPEYLITWFDVKDDNWEHRLSYKAKTLAEARRVYVEKDHDEQCEAVNAWKCVTEEFPL